MKEGLNKTALAKELGVSRSSLYYKPKIPERDELLRQKIEEVMEAHPAYGHRRIALDLGINRKRALRVMKKYHLKPARRCRAPSKPLDTGVSKKETPCVTKVWSPVAINMLWTGDFTFIWFQGRFIYLAVVQDRYSAFVLGAMIMLNHSSELVMTAMSDALKKAGTCPEWFHSDLGSEYTSDDFEQLLLSNGIKISNSPKASPWRNPSQESFFGRFKVEFDDPARFKNLEELMIAIYQFIHYYNYERIHTRLKMTPARFFGDK